MPNTIIKKLFCMSFISLSSICFANIESLKNFEKKVLLDYQNTDYFAVNGEIEQIIINELSLDPDSFKYDFPLFKQIGYLHTQYSPDKKLKFYTFDVSGGGTMGEWSNYVQYYTGKNIHLDEFQAGFVLDIYPVTIQKKNVYLVKSYYKGDSCHGMYHLRAVEIGPKFLLKSYIFEAKNKKHHEMNIEYDCQYDPDRNKASTYFRIQPNTVDVMLLNEQGIPQNKYLRYRLNQDGFHYTGIVK